MKINNKSFILLWVLIFVLAGLMVFFDVASEKKQPDDQEAAVIGEKPKGIMILIEYKDTIGLANFVNELNKRGIHGLLHVSQDFVQENCEEIKQLLNYNIEIMGSVSGEALWDIPYEEQKELISEMKDSIEACTGAPLRIISSRYMASDITTVQVAQELGIPYVTARGTTDSKATVYGVEGFDVKILSVSNIPKVQFKYGSLCDYSYYERAGTPDDMLAELRRAAEPLSEKEQVRYGSEHRITPVSHTNIGGYLDPWMDMWIDFWDSTKEQINWVGLDEFMAEEDWILPEWQIPINKNAPYTPEKIRPLILYEDVEKVDNPCAVGNIENSRLENEGQTSNGGKEINGMIIFHNGRGQMCLDALSFIEKIDYPTEQFLEGEEDFYKRLNELTSNFSVSEGVSDSFGYYPIIFVGERAFSGFSEEIKEAILDELES